MSGGRTDYKRLAVRLSKVVDYLLNEAHPDGGPKARFFLAHGFSARNPNMLAASLITHAEACGAGGAVVGPFGLRIVFEGPLRTPAGTAPRLRAVWHVEHGSDTAYLVTAYPA